MGKKLILKGVILGIATTLLTFGISVFAGIDQNEIPISGCSMFDVVTLIQKDGIKNVSSIEFDDSVWKIETTETVKTLSTITTQIEKEYVIDPAVKKCELIRSKTETEDDAIYQASTSMDNLSTLLNLVKAKYKTIRSIELNDESNTWEVKVLENNSTTERELIVDLTGTKILLDKIDD